MIARLPLSKAFSKPLVCRTQDELRNDTSPGWGTYSLWSASARIATLAPGVGGPVVSKTKFLYAT